MRMRIIYLILIIVVLVLLLLGVCKEFLLGFPRVYSINMDFDLNSGDVRWYTYACFLKIKDEIKTTQFSKEVRRLGIDVPQERKWAPTYTKFLINKDVLYVYGQTPGDCNYLIKLFDKGNVSDEDRRIILQKFITILQTGDHRNVPRMIAEEVQSEVEKVYKVEK
jgi:hypothetical protein